MKETKNNLMQNKLAVTGITNNPGRVFIEYLGKNIDLVYKMFPGGVKAVYRSSSNISEYERLIPDGEKALCDLTNIFASKDIFQDVDTIVHIAGIRWSREVIEAAVFCGVRRIIVIHTCGIYSKYKKAGEEYRQIEDYCCKMCKDNNISLTILRPTMIYGNCKDRNVIKFIKMVDKLPIMPVVNGGKYTLQPVNYKDLGKAIFDVLINEKSTSNTDFIISGEKPILLRDLFTEIGSNLGKKVHFINCPFWIAYPGAWVLYLITFCKIDLREKVQRLCEDRSFSHEKAMEAFGFTPICFQKGIAEEVSEYKKSKTKQASRRE